MQEAKSKIERRLQQEQQKKAYDEYVKSLEQRYPVKIYDENITADAPQTPPAQLPPQAQPVPEKPKQ
jgi:hypothetical protein